MADTKTPPPTLDYAAVSRRRFDVRTVAAAILVSIAGVLALANGAEAAYRYWLFRSECGSAINLNHVGEGAFVQTYKECLVAVTGALAAAILFKSRVWRFVAVITCISALLACAAFFSMHRTGILVEYMEYIKYTGGG